MQSTRYFVENVDKAENDQKKINKAFKLTKSEKGKIIEKLN